MFKLAVFNNISDKGLCLLSEDTYATSKEISNDSDGILLRSAKLHDIEMPNTIKAIARAGAGTNNIPVDACAEKGIVVFNTPGANANGVCELTVLGMLLSSRDVYGGIKWAEGIKENISKAVEKGKSNFAGPEIKGKTLGVIGLGAIGVLVANVAIKLGMKVVGYDPYMSVKNAIGLSWDVEYSNNLDDLLANADYISLHLPLMDKTKSFINKEQISKMKDGVRLLNFARGGLVNNEDVVSALNDRKIYKYVTDFPTDEIQNNPNAICIPHLGASTPESEENCARMAVSQLIDFLENGNIKNSVNFPTCCLERKKDLERITVINKNIPNMINSLTGVLAKNNINISEMVNKSRNDYAYNIIDIKGTVSKEILDEIREIEGILKVRLIK